MFNNKFGKGILKHPGYNIDGGFGEAALMGALVGGGTSLLTGSNPLTGALLGGLTGGAMNGISGALGSAGGSTAETAVQNELAKSAVDNGVTSTISNNLGSTVSGLGTEAADAGIRNLANSAVNLDGTLANLGTNVASDTAQAGLTGLTAGTGPGGIPEIGMNANQALSNAGIQGNLPQVNNLDFNRAISPNFNVGAPAAGTDAVTQSMANNAAQNTIAQAGSQQAAGTGVNLAGYNASPVGSQQIPGTGVKLAGYNAPSISDVGTKTVGDLATKTATKPGFFTEAKDWWGGLEPWQKAGVGIGGGVGLHYLMQPPKMVDPNVGKSEYKGPKLHDLSPDFQGYVATPNVYQSHYAEGGVTGLRRGGLDDQSPMALGMGGNQGYPGGRLDMTQYATPTQQPTSTPVVNSGYEQRTNAYTGEPQGFAFGGDVDPDDMTAAAPSVANTAARIIGNTPVNQFGAPHFAMGGGIGSLGGYAAGGNPHLLNGPGDGMSDSIPATIGGRQPARLAQGEFVIPADVVSHLGNGSTDAGAKHLYAMMDKVRKARTGRVSQGKQINPNHYLPA